MKTLKTHPHLMRGVFASVFAVGTLLAAEHPNFDGKPFVMAAAMQELMGMSEMEGMEITIDIPVVRGESTLASFNAVEPIVIPEAALSAPEA